jgi:hypothetical protein
MKSRSTNDKRMRLRLTLEAARLMADEGIASYYKAKFKAAERLGVSDTRNMPGNDEIEQALMDYQRLFKADTQPAALRQLREAALKAMQFFDDFTPRLVGPVLNGTANEYSEVQLHAFTDTPEQISLFLIGKNIPFELGERRLTFSKKGTPVTYPVYRFVAGEVGVEVIVFPVDGIRQAPLSPVDGRPIKRAPAAAVERLMKEESGGGWEEE